MKYPKKQMAWNINMAIIQYHDITIIITYSPPLACYQNWIWYYCKRNECSSI